MSMPSDNSSSLSELRKSNKTAGVFLTRFKELFPFLFDIKSLFYFFWFIVLLGFAWAFYGMVTNGFTTLYNWDYNSQYVTFAYNYYDDWHSFLRTGHFNLYSTQTFLGSDNIGSNSYYGLFDPFIVVMIFFPRSWIPHMFMILTFVKGAVGALCMRSFLRYRGVSETTSRIGATAFAFCGFINFMVGFPSVVSAAIIVPLLLLGIEKVLKEKKPNTLVFAVFLAGIICFFYLVIYCIFGVLYALWRYFMTIKTRKVKDNWLVIAYGVGAFALGLCLCSFVLLPSLRETSLSGRTTSIGTAYLNYLLKSIKTFDVATSFHLIFEMVGDHPGRELMCLISFFFPTVNYTYLPMEVITTGTGTGYDAWTASIFCYTPMAILFIYSLIGSTRRKEWGKLVGFALISIMCFTNFSYYFFYAFSGDGYGRWLVVIAPLIIMMGCQEFDKLKENPDWQLPIASFATAGFTMLTVVIAHYALDGKTFLNPNNQTYWPSSYAPISQNGTIWVVVYQICLALVEALVITILRNNEKLPKIMIGFIAVETIVAGNLSFVFGSQWSYQNWYGGGASNRFLSQQSIDQMESMDDFYYRTYTDYFTTKNDGMLYGYNGTSNFHSLFNYDLAEFCRLTGITRNEKSPTKTYGDATYVGKNWSAIYNNKRYGFDTAVGIKYYIIRNEGYGNFLADSFREVNVPFGSTCVYKNENFRIYQSGTYVPLGHAVDNVYYFNHQESEYQPNKSSFYAAGGNGFMSQYSDLLRNEEVIIDSAIVEDDAKEAAGISFEQYSGRSVAASIKSLASTYYETISGYGYNVSDPASFLFDSSLVTKSSNSWNSITPDDGKVVYYPFSGSGSYINDDPRGALFNFEWSTSSSCRIYMVGDTFDEKGNLIEENKVLNYEYQAFKMDHGDQMPLYGMYAEGRVKWIILCPKKGWGDNVRATLGTLYVTDRSVIDSKTSTLKDQEHALSNPTYSSDKFSFDTNYSAPKMVVTQLGYDQGWSVTATDKDGKTIEGISTYKLDGGLVGFNAPAGEAHYVLTYVTPYVNGGVALAVIAGFILAGFNVITFILEARKEREKASLVNKEKASIAK